MPSAPSTPTLRIAMWSGPRNISTALMRSWGNRPDTAVCDEPLYAHYLEATGLPHPGAEEIIAHHEDEWAKVVTWLAEASPGDKPIFYQKHMAHHLLPGIDTDWLLGLRNCFLIREPREMLTSLVKIIPEPRLEDTAFPQQVRIFELVHENLGGPPPVIDSRDVLDDPEGQLRVLCHTLGVEFTDAMLSWPAGPRDTDGIWAKHWYGSVEHSTGFMPYTPKDDVVPPRLQGVYEQCCELYDQLYAHRLTPNERRIAKSD